MDTWIKADDTLLLWAFVMLAATAAVVMEQRAGWAAKVPGAVTALLIALAASNFGLIPTDAPVYDAVWGYIVPLAIPLLLFQLDIRSVFRESRRLLLLFAISSAGTVVGVMAGFALLKDRIPELDKVAGMIAASYTGGGVNFAAMTAKLEPSKDITSAAVVADNLMMACYFLILITLAVSGFARRVWGSPYSNQVSQAADGRNQAAEFWKPKAISLESMALSLGGAILLVAVSFTVSKFLKGILSADGNIALEMLFALLTDKYLLLTTLTFAAIWLLPKQTAKLNGSQELGMYCIFLFFVVIGVPASIPLILQNTPLLFVFTLTVAVVNLAVTLLAGKLLKYSIEEVVLACNANIGGPTTAAALAIGQGWRALVGPILVIGTAGYIVGNYIGSLVYALLGS